MFNRRVLSLGSAIAALLLGRGGRTPSTHPAATSMPAARPLGQKVASRGRGKTRLAQPRRGNRLSATVYLGKRNLHPGRSSSLRKLQRAFRIAGQSFTPDSAGKGRGR